MVTVKFPLAAFSPKEDLMDNFRGMTRTFVDFIAVSPDCLERLE
jgi:hypothetical protein